MKHVLLLAVAALSVPAVLGAQSSSTPLATSAITVTRVIIAPDGATTPISVQTIQVSSCPVAMQAKQGSGSGMVMVHKGKQGDSDSPPATNSKPGQAIHLILGRMPGAHFSDPGQIVGASITARGLSARDHFGLALELNGNGASDLRRTMNVKFSTDGEGTVSADLDLPGFTSVNTIKLESVELRDGSTWNLDDLKSCVVTPDRMMLIANQ